MKQHLRFSEYSSNFILFYLFIHYFSCIIAVGVNVTISEKQIKDWYKIGLVGRVFVNGPGDLGSIPGHVIPDFKNGTWYLLA